MMKLDNGAKVLAWKLEAGSDGEAVVLAHRPGFLPWVTWRAARGEGEGWHCYAGRYFETEAEARQSFAERN